MAPSRVSPKEYWVLVCWVVGLLISHANQAAAGEVEVRLTAVEKTHGVISGHLEFQPIGGKTAQSLKVRSSKVSIPGSTQLDLPTGSIWLLDLKAPGHWSPPTIVTAANTATAVDVNVWPTTEVRGTVEMPPSEELPEALKIRFQSSGDVGDETVSESTFECPIQVDGQWVCELPVDRLDLRLRAPGFVSHYFWGQQLTQGNTLNVGVLKLKRGASITGRVVAQMSNFSAHKASVSVLPVAAGYNPTQKERERFKKLAIKTRPTDRGFFHLEGIQPGSYTITAEHPGFASAWLSPVHVMENAETELQDPLELAPPLDLEVRIEPPTDALGEVWHVRVWQRSEIPGTANEVAERDASASGAFVERGLTPGSYLVFVEDSTGAQLGLQEFELMAAQTTVHFDLPLVWVEGELTLGDKPLAADLWFGGLFGNERVQMSSDEDGKFLGYLPREGEWSVQIQCDAPSIERNLAKVEVEKRKGKGSAYLEISLPDTMLVGEVVNEEGQGVQAMVRLYEPERLSSAGVLTDKEGHFSFHGLAVGRHRLAAESTTEGGSEEVSVDVMGKNEEGPNVRLILRKWQELTGQVVSPHGPVAGAAVWAVPTRGGEALSGVPSKATTDVTGRFKLSVTRGSSHIELTVFPPGYALAMRSIASDAAEFLKVEVTPYGGVLKLEFDEVLRWRDVSSPKPVLFFEGRALSTYALQYWSEVNGGGGWESTNISVLAMPHGQYTACIRKGAEQHLGRCVEGYLAPASELTMKLKPD